MIDRALLVQARVMPFSTGLCAAGRPCSLCGMAPVRELAEIHILDI